MKVKEKKVNQIELFYDLIYVYAISKLTLLIEEPVNGGLTFGGVMNYLLASFVILQAWLYMTNYINRYGTWRWYEYVLLAVNMSAAVYMANTIQKDASGLWGPFNLSMLAMLLCVSALYFKIKKQDPGAAKNSLSILLVAEILYFLAFLAGTSEAASLALGLDTAAVLTGAFLPFFIRGNFSIEIISFPHLMERFELITIITFGEAVVGLAGFFDVRDFSILPIMAFALIILLFGCYNLQLHVLCQHKRTERGLRLMFTHYFIVISVNFLTVALDFLENPEAGRLVTALMMIFSLAVFYLCIYVDSAYYYPGISFERHDVQAACLYLIIGSLIIVLGRGYTYVVLIGALLEVGGNFCLLLRKYKENKKTIGLQKKEDFEI